MTEYQLTETDIVIRAADRAYIPNDPANRDRAEYDRWLAAGGVPDPYVPLPTFKELSSRQFWTQMAIANFIDESEAVKALGGDIPHDIKQFIDTLPVLQRFPARMFFEAPTFDRYQRAASDLQACFSLTSAAIDQFFQNAAEL